VSLASRLRVLAIITVRIPPIVSTQIAAS
jgi:hypothetical protein